MSQTGGIKLRGKNGTTAPAQRWPASIITSHLRVISIKL